MCFFAQEIIESIPSGIIHGKDAIDPADIPERRMPWIPRDTADRAAALLGSVPYAGTENVFVSDPVNIKDDGFVRQKARRDPFLSKQAKTSVKIRCERTHSRVMIAERDQPEKLSSARSL